MADRVVLHIGAMKSGTSFIQHVLNRNRQALADQGMFFAGRRWRQQVSAVSDLAERGGKGQEPLDPEGPWHTLAADINGRSGTALVSMEFLGPRPKRKIGIIKESFGEARVEAVLTARDLTRNIPAMWQESVQNTNVVTWEEFLEAVRTEDADHRAGRSFWKHQAVAGIAERWSKALGPDRFTLVTVPPPGAPPTLLWERFAAAVGLDPAPFDLAVRRNPSIGAASALVLRGLNERLNRDPLPRQVYLHYVKGLLAKRGLAHRETDDPSFGIDEPWAMELAERELRRMRRLAPQVVGSLEDLKPRPVPGLPPGAVSTEQQLEAALDGLALVLRA